MSGRPHTSPDRRPRRRRIAVTIAAAFAVVTIPLRTELATAVPDVCVPRTVVKTGAISWKIRQASGLTTVPASPGVLFTHNDRGIRDSPAPDENTTQATVWAMTPQGTILARLLLVDAGGAPISYFDTEAIATDPSGRIVLADTGTNIDGRVTVALYRFTPPVVSVGQPFAITQVEAEVIPVQYFNKASSTTAVKLNVEAMTIAPSGAAWFVARTSTRPYSYTASAAALDEAVATQVPLRAVRSVRLTVDGPMTDASLSPDKTMLLIKNLSTTFAYHLTSHGMSAALGTTPCVVASAPKASAAGYGEAIAARDDGGFFTVKESAKTLHSGTGAPIWSFNT